MDPLQQILADMKSATKISERKSAAQRLVDYLDGNVDECCETLDFNSVSSDKTNLRMTWTKLFIEVCEFFRKETEKGTATTVNKLAVFGVVRTVFVRATRSRPWLAWNKILDFIIINLQTDRQASQFGRPLMNLLEMFLAVDLYRTVINASSWIELITVLIRCNGKYNITTQSLLKCLNVCIEQGSLYGPVISVLRSSVVNFYTKIVERNMRDLPEYLELYLHGATSLSKMNANEFRGILCKFGENVIPFILQIPSFKDEQEKILVEFLSVQFGLHMPCDIDMSSPAFYAVDPGRWKEILRLIYSYCIDTIEDIANKRSSRRQNVDDNIRVRTELLRLAARCTKQISSPSLIENVVVDSDEDDISDRNVSKKKMRYKSFHTIIADVHCKQPTEGLMTWLEYLTAVVTDFPQLVGTRTNYSNLVHLGCSLFNTNYMLRREYYNYFISLLKAEKFLRSTGTVNQSSDTWKTVWDLTLKSISVCNDKHRAMALLQQILKEVQPPNVSAMLSLYINNLMPPGRKASVQLLGCYLSLCSLPAQLRLSSNTLETQSDPDEEFAATPCPRLKLLKWLVKVVSLGDIAGYESTIAKVMCSLLVKQSHTLLHSCIANGELDVKYDFHVNSYVEFEKILLKSCFTQPPLPIDSSNVIPNNSVNCSSKYVLEKRLTDQLLATLKTDFESMPALQLESSGSLHQYKRLIAKLNVCMSVYDQMQKIAVEDSKNHADFLATLEKICDSGLEKCVKYITASVSQSFHQNNPETITMMIKYTRLLFPADNICTQMKTLIVQKFTRVINEVFKKIFQNNLARYMESLMNNSHESAIIQNLEQPNIAHPNGVELELITRKDRGCEKMSLEALAILVDYGLICDRRAEFFAGIIDDLLAESYCNANQFIFDAVAQFIHKVAKNLASVDLSNLTDQIITLLQKCCRGFYQFPICSERLWLLFKEMIPVVAGKNEDCRKNFIILVGTLHNFLKQDNQTPRFVFERAFETLMELSKHDEKLTWTEFTPKKAPTIWILQETHEFLLNPSHRVKMLAVDTICCMYQNAYAFEYSGDSASSQSEASTDTSSDEYQEKRKTFLDQTLQKFLASFEIPNDLSAEEMTEESINRTSLMLSCFSRLIFAFPYTQKQTIMFLFSAMQVKNIDVNLATRALLYISSSSPRTLSCYFPYLLKKFLKLKKNIKDLPFQFFGCTSFDEFLEKFRNDICVEYFEQDRMRELEAFADYMNVEVQTLITGCYGLIMARITPGLAIHQYSLSTKGVNLVANNEVHKRLITILGGKNVTDTLMATCFGDVVLNLISLIFEPEIVNEWACPDVKFSEPVPPHYSESTIEACLLFLKDASPRSSSVIGYLTETSNYSVYNILLSLATKIHEAPDALQRYWRLHQFSFFVRQLLQERDVFSRIKEYVCNFVFNTYFRLLKDKAILSGDISYRLQFIKVIFHLIYNLVNLSTVLYPDEMRVFFVPVIRNIVSVSLTHPSLLHSAKLILDYLLKEKGGDFSDCIESLDPFPQNVRKFHEYHIIHNDIKYGSGDRITDWSLTKEFERILQQYNTTAATKGSCTKESLQFLQELLSRKKRDLERMVKNLESKRFSDECAQDPLHSIIQMLTNIAVSSNKDQDVIVEACKCLGEIGPVDLSVLVLPPYKSQGKIHSAETALTEILKIICSYQASNDIQIVITAGNVLRLLCQFEECSSIVNVVLRNTRLFKLLQPFRNNQIALKQSDDKIQVNLLETKLGLNEMNESIDFKPWVTQLTTGILECFCNSSSSLPRVFLPLCELRADFCEDVLPYVIYLALSGARSKSNLNPMVRKTFSGYFRAFFSKFITHYNNVTDMSRSFTPSSNGTSNTVIYMNKLALRLLIRVIQFLRRHPLPREGGSKLRTTPWDSNFWLDINYLDVSRAAQYCGAYLTSVLYIEIAATEMDMSRPRNQYQSTDAVDDSYQTESFSQGTCMYPRSRSEASKIEKLLLKAYSSIGELDASYGCGSARFADTQSSMHHLEQIMDWQRLLMLSNGSSVTNDVQDHLQTCSDQHAALALKQLGLQNILWTYLKGVETIGNGILPEDLAQAQYECGWRLSRWDLKSDKPTYLKNVIDEESQCGFQMCVYEGIQSGIANDISNCVTSVKNGFKSVCYDFRHATLESSENIYGYLSKFQMLRIIEDFFGKMKPDDSVQNFIRKWKLHEKIPSGDFKYQEPSLYLRNVLLRAFDQKNPRANLEGEISDSLLYIISKARNSGRLDLAESCTASLNSCYSKPSMKLEFEVAKNHWKRGNTDIARDILNRLIKKSSAEDDLFPTFLLVYGDWLSISLCERPSAILEKYLQRSCKIYEKRGNSKQDLSNAYITLAKYADSQYQNITRYMSSEVFISKRELVKKAQDEQMQFCQPHMDLESKKSMMISKKHSNNDAEEILYIANERSTFLKLALRNYMKGLKLSNENDLLIFRAISLWLENGSDTDNNLVNTTNQIIREETLPSYKYTAVLHQLSARLGSNINGRDELLREILLKCGEEHPYHALPVLLTQASLHKDQVLPRATSNTKVHLAERVQAAAEIVNELKHRNNNMKNLVKKMEVLWHTLIELGNMQEPASRNVEGVDKPMPPAVMKQLTNLDIVAVPTSWIPILPSGNYKETVIRIKEFGNKFGLVGGINSPKKIKCRGSNGSIFNMLLKGQDDLRQDAVMQQVFGVMNDLLKSEPRTKMRRLQIRTYKVVPLSQRTGVIEWVENTQTFGEYLVGDRKNAGAHTRYRPEDLPPLECRKLLNDVRGSKDPEARLATYFQICENFKPVFRHFFFENFKEPGEFFEKRLAYIRSVATTSIVGYILGLGDRHVQNILIDKSTAEFIHIDLGVAFEQGRILPTPETIPFRLSRDVVDGMGISGVEGVFRKSCEETMHVLRNHSEIIITVLQVLLYDPLYMWALTTDRVAKVQPSDAAKPGRQSKGYVEQEDSVKEQNSSASRVLLRLRQKLMGIEEEGGACEAISSGSTLSVSGHVSLLIQRAADPEKLANVFPGWQPYL